MRNHLFSYVNCPSRAGLQRAPSNALCRREIDMHVVDSAICRSAGEVGKTGEVVPDVYMRTLIRAAEIVGGAQELAFRLKVTPSHLSLWMGGLEPCPGHVFLKAVDVVLERGMQAQRGPAAEEGSEPQRPADPPAVP